MPHFSTGKSLTEPSTRRLSLAKDHLKAKANETFSVPWHVEKIPREAHPARPATSTHGGMVSVPLGNLRTTAARCVYRLKQVLLRSITDGSKRG